MDWYLRLPMQEDGLVQDGKKHARKNTNSISVEVQIAPTKFVPIVFVVLVIGSARYVL